MNNPTKNQSAKITDYQLIDHGVEHQQYFQGCGTAFTPYAHCVTGSGGTFGEALDDALNQIAIEGPDGVAEILKSRIKADEGYADKPWPVEPSASSVFRKHNPEAYDEETGDWDMEECELYYYVSVRYSTEGEEA